MEENVKNDQGQSFKILLKSLAEEQAATHEAGKVTMKDFEIAVQAYFAKQKT
jgi:hypothetical protein